MVNKSFIIGRFFLFAFLLMILPQCKVGSGGADSGKISFVALPDTPLVLNAPITVSIGGVETTINPPWFKFRFKMSNDLVEKSASDVSQDLYIVALKIEVVGTEFEAIIDPSQFSSSAAELLTVEAKSTESASATEVTFNGVIYIQSLPEQNGSFNYNIIVTPIGWFGDKDNQYGRFSNTYYFSTE